MTNILITGASSGIGYDTALALAADPAHRVIALARNKQKLEALAAAAEGRIETLCYDLTAPDEAVLTALLDRVGELHILINNAGLLVNKPFVALSDADWMSVFATNLFGPVALTRAVLPYMQRAAGSAKHIVNIGSMGGFQGSSKFPGLSAYSAAKAALANFTECLAEELKEEGIAVNCLAFGAVQTEMLATAFPGYQAPVDSATMGGYLAWFATGGQRLFNGKILPVSVSTP